VEVTCGGSAVAVAAVVEDGYEVCGVISMGVIVATSALDMVAVGGEVGVYAAVQPTKVPSRNIRLMYCFIAI
jgi:hypothetical protein